jgi:shikimate kinase
MGSGKSTIGRLLAQELSLEFIDVDKVIEDRAGANIPWIFDVEGESGFRDREENVMDELTQLDNIVLATGGGAILRDSNRRHLRARGHVVYLKTSVDHQLERTAKDKNRPLLQAENPRAILERLLEIREPLYLECCDVLVKTDRRHPKGVVSDIVRQVNERISVGSEAN